MDVMCNYVHLVTTLSAWKSLLHRTWKVERQWSLPNPVLGLGITRRDKVFGPGTLRACRALTETLRYYTPLFKDESTIPTIYFSPSRDTLSLEQCFATFNEALRGVAPKTEEMPRRFGFSEVRTSHEY